MPFQPWLRGSLEGISPDRRGAAALAARPFRRGIFTTSNSTPGSSDAEDRDGGRSRGSSSEANFKPELIQANVRRLRKLVGAHLEGRRHRLDRVPRPIAPTATPTRSARPTSSTRRRVGAARADLGPGLQRRRLLAARRRAAPTRWSPSTTTTRRSTPCTARCATRTSDASCRWWRPRRPLARPRLAGAGAPAARGARHAGAGAGLALVHHLSITANVPLPEVLDWLVELGAHARDRVPDREDPMVRRLLSGKREGPTPTTSSTPSSGCSTSASTSSAPRSFHPGDRVLYLARPRA